MSQQTEQAIAKQWLDDLVQNAKDEALPELADYLIAHAERLQTLKAQALRNELAQPAQKPFLYTLR